MAFQYPATIPGVSVANFLRMAVNARREEPIKVKEFGQVLGKNMELLKIDRAFTSRYLNEGFSGGEKKRAEILQLAMLAPGLRGARRDRLRARHRRAADRVRRRERAARRRRAASSSSPTTRASSATCAPTSCTSCSTAGSSARAAPELADELEDKGYEWVKEEVAASAPSLAS